MSNEVVENNAKIQRLDMVFKKAIDVASNSLDNSDLDACFQDLKAQYGNILPKLFMNTIAKSQQNIEAAYKDICIIRGLEESVRSLDEISTMTASSSSSAEYEEMGESFSETNVIPPVVLIDLKKLEAENLRKAIESMEMDINKMSDEVGRIKKNISTEMTAVNEEGVKLGMNS